MAQGKATVMSPGQPQGPALVVTQPQVLAELVQGGILEANGVIHVDGSGLPFLSERVHGANVHHEMGSGKEDGNLRLEEGKVQIYLGTGKGAESYAWQPFNPNTPSHVLRAWYFQRYGPNWSSGGNSPSGGFAGHSTDISGQLETVLGRKPAFREVYDVVYGVSDLKAPTSSPANPVPGREPSRSPERPVHASEMPTPGVPGSNPAQPLSGDPLTTKVKGALDELDVIIKKGLANMGENAGGRPARALREVRARLIDLRNELK